MCYSSHVDCPEFNSFIINTNTIIAEMTRILVVEDEPDLRELLKFHLKLAGFLVDEAESAMQTLENLSRHKYDLVLLDMHLPDRPGTDVLRYITYHQINCKVVVITGVHGLETAIECVSFGAADYITKPFEMEHLLGSISKALNPPTAA